MISKIVAAVIADLSARLFAWLLAQRAKQTTEAASETAIDQKVIAVQTAMKETLDGQPATPEQKAKMREAFRDLVRGGPSSGL